MIEILLVDDESYVTESLALTIPWRELGISHVYQAASSAAAMQILEEQSIDIVVTDIRMPGMDGLQLIETISNKWKDIHCILLTGHSDFKYTKRAIQLEAADYILKPVDDEEFIRSIASAVEAIQVEWEQSEKQNELLYQIKSDFSLLRASLLHDLLLGRRPSRKTLIEKLTHYEIRVNIGDSAFMMLIQLGKLFSKYDAHSLSLIEYAVGNISEEIFAANFHVWFSKTPHDTLVMIASWKPQAKSASGSVPSTEASQRRVLETTIRQFQQQVEVYLKGNVSIIVTEPFLFPDELPAAYRRGLGSIYAAGDSDESSTIYLTEGISNHAGVVISLESLYKPPTLIHLLESKQWDAAHRKVNAVFEDIEQIRFSREHLYEVFLYVTNAFMYTAHKRGQFMHEIDHFGFDLLLDRSMIHSLDKLRDWSIRLLDKLKGELTENERYTKSYVVRQVQEIVVNDRGQDSSVKTIAERIFLHPVYLSKIYKEETGESLGDYIIRMRMERALYLLKNTNKRMYEITAELGYQNPQYFSKMFKKYYGMTPHEFRD